MVDEHDELRRINWNEVFSFAQIFKSFKMAIHPSKLFLALAAIILIGLSGWVMDRLWSVSSGGFARQGEIYAFVRQRGDVFDDAKEKWQEGRLRNAVVLYAEALMERRDLKTYLAELSGAGAGDFAGVLRNELKEYNKSEDEDKIKPVNIQAELKIAKDKGRGWSYYLSEAEDEFCREADKIKTLLERARDAAEKQVKEAKGVSDDDKDKSLESIERQWYVGQRLMAERRLYAKRQIEDIRGKGIFESLRDYELACVEGALKAIRDAQIITGLGAYQAEVADTSYAPPAKLMAPPPIPAPRGAPAAETPRGLLYWVLMAVQGIRWLLVEHWLYGAVFLLISLMVWAFFGGAIHRIAALHAAREEKISAIQAMKFSCTKFLSFCSAPLIPLILIMFCAGLLALGGAVLGNFAGGLLMSILFGLALLLGLGIAFLTVGLVAGMPLMYPTIAVEGSDSFDAMSRSVSYVFSRPWRALFYGLVAIVYGAITYLFVRLFAYIALSATHMFVKWGIWVSGETVARGADRMDVLWRAPTFWSLHGPMNLAAMGTFETIAGYILAIWVYLIIGMVAAYFLTYAVSASTIIYYLLRRKVDATDLDDVYVEEGEEEPLPTEAEPAPAEDEGGDESKTESKDEQEQEQAPGDENQGGE